MGEVGVDRGGDDLAADLPELFGSITESDDLSRTNEGEVQGIEEEDDVFTCTRGKQITPSVM